MASAMHIIMVIVVIIAILFIVIDVTKTYHKCPPKTTEYRFIPRSFREEQENPVPLDDIFFEMFNNPGPWINLVDMEERKSELLKSVNRDLGRLDIRGFEDDITKYFISQV